MAQLRDTKLYYDANLQEYYKLEDTSGKNGNTLTNNNSVAFNAAKFLNGADLGSADGNKTLSQASAFSYAGGAYSITFWVKINTEPGSGVLYDLIQLSDVTTSHTQLYLAYYNPAGTPELYFARTRINVADDVATFNVTLGTSVFHHMVFTYDATNIRVYLDGVLVAGPTAASGTGTLGTGGFVIGGQTNDLTANNALAIIDDVGLFNRVLTPLEVWSLYAPPGLLSMFP